ncbi:MAG: 50S ribosomal protein L23 [Parcubacteria group bacterium]|nr:50S ribosomal protein L23 [Parcubacteria group bacterium]
MSVQTLNNQKNSLVLLRMRVTEKAAISAEKNAYTFLVADKATKPEIKAAVKEIYKVTPTQVNVIAGVKKSITRRGRKGVKGANKKAIVFLKKGDKIEFI